MKRTPLIKAVTLCSFFALIALFLVYRSGKLDTYVRGDDAALQGSPNGGPVAKTKTDSTRLKADSARRRVRMSSSKSMVMDDDIRMSSSKSGPVFEVEKDTVKKDTSKAQKK